MEKQMVSPGLYRVYWKTGRASLVSIGMGADGEMWFAPTNWCTPDNRIPWEQMESCENLNIEKEPLEESGEDNVTHLTVPNAHLEWLTGTPETTNGVGIDWLSDRIKWFEERVREFEIQFNIFDSGILNKLMTFVRGSKKYPYIEGDKLIFDMKDKATHAAVHEYAKASVHWGHGSEEFVSEKCNDLLRKISEFQKEE